ncbi:hypothetical protein GCM10022393_42570 [Aquimarina addita]|uniref:Uncharacterized protein n=1 Tax=Aquimarina addita TaxID=870485 RepID=A0ABP6UZC8_9FLAO
MVHDVVKLLDDIADSANFTKFIDELSEGLVGAWKKLDGLGADAILKRDPES